MFQFSVRGCRLKIHFSLFVLIAFCNLATGFTNGMLMLMVIIVHEGAHLSAMLITQNIPDCVQLSALGMRIVLPVGRQIPYRHNIAISLAGPAMNFICGVVLMVLGFADAAYMNFALGIFHALPIEPLDGGLALHAFVSSRMDEQKAEGLTSFVSLLLILPIMIVGFMLLISTKSNYSLLAVAVYLMLYLVLKNSKFL